MIFWQLQYNSNIGNIEKLSRVIEILKVDKNIMIVYSCKLIFNCYTSQKNVSCSYECFIVFMILI